jgi:phosphoenolpyruvate carboxylase
MVGTVALLRTLLSNMDMVLAKSDLALASRYAELVPDRRLRERVHAPSKAEWQRTAQALGMITGRSNSAWQRRAATLDPPPVPLHRPAAPPAGRTDPAPPRRRA